MNVKELKEMLQLMADHDLAEMEIEKDGMKIRLRKSGGVRQVEEYAPMAPVLVPMPGVAAEKPASGGESFKPHPHESANVTQVCSPMVGTFYASPSPDLPAYVIPGKQVKEGDVLCIVEAMKLMNEIKSEVTGTVTEVLVKNGQPVEYDQPLFKIQKG